MPISRKDDNAGRAASSAPSRRVLGMNDTSRLPSKRTLNLCMREKDSMSVETFLLILSIILIVIILIEFVGVFWPYTRVEALERDLAAQQAALDDKNNKMKDYDEVQDYYHEYNYEGFDRSIADRIDVLAILEREIINKEFTHTGADGPETYKVTLSSISITGKNLTVTINGIYGGQISELETNLEKDPLVERATHSGTNYEPNKKVPSVVINITLADASTVPTAA